MVNLMHTVILVIKVLEMYWLVAVIYWSYTTCKEKLHIRIYVDFRSDYHTKTGCKEMQDENTCHMKKLWLHLEEKNIQCSFPAACASLMMSVFFTPNHHFCMRPAIMTDCGAKEKRKSTSHLPYLSFCCLISLPASHCLCTQHTLSMLILKIKVLEDSGLVRF